MASIRSIIGLGRRLSWRKPGNCDVLQFLGTTIGALQSLQSEFRVGCMPSVVEQLNAPVFIRSLCLGRFGRWGYYRTFVELTGARVVLVWHDTSVEAYQIQRRLPVPVWMIQNGVRHDVAPASGLGLVTLLQRLNAREKPAVSRYFSFGEPARALLAPLVDADFVPVGSFRLNDYATRRKPVARNPGADKRRIGFIVSFPNYSDVPGGRIAGNGSPFVRVGGHEISYERYYYPEAVILRILASVAKAGGHGLSVIGKRSSRDPIERQYFSEMSGCESIEVVAHEKGHGYEYAEDYEWLITVDSTLGYEMLALNHKVAFISNRFRMLGVPTTEMAFAQPSDLPSDGPFWTSAITEPAITRFLTAFLQIEESEWEDLRSSIVPRLMRLDPGNQTLRRLIAAEVGGVR